MNVRLKKTFGWYGAVVYEDQFIITHYSSEVSMVTVTPDNQEQNIAYERIKLFMNDIMDGAVLINQNNPKLDQYQNIGMRLIALPDEPVDQVVGMMLYLKLNAVMENRMVVTDVELWSRAGDSMSYLHSAGESLGPLSQDGWWIDPRPCYSNSIEKATDKIVNLARMPEWHDHGLDWMDKENSTDSVVFAKFGRDEDE